MLDLRFVRENQEAVAQAMRNRNAAWDAEAFARLDGERRDAIQQEEALQAERNALSKQVGALMGQGRADEAEAAKNRVRQINEELEGASAARAAADEQLTNILLRTPNMPSADTPVGADEDDNPEVRRWGAPRTFDFEPKPHWDLGASLGIIDAERGAKLARSRFMLLGGLGARLERSLINFMADTHASRGYKEWWCPALANEVTMTGTGQLPKFEEDMFRTREGLYLIPTAEVQLTNIHAGETLDAADLPLRYCGFTPCFREEAGSAGRDTRGLIRVHQFDKVEMVKFATPEQSYAELEAMTADAENILQLLGLPYRVISLCTGDIGFSAAKTYDVEVYLPSYQGYKEISSCSNCEDFQARRMGIRYRDPESFKGSRLVHTLNGSGLAVGRTMAAILENYQEEDGSVRVPEALVPYMGTEVIEPA
ncbi:serine--tRNA ligase [Eggerthellaceae bacterium zg-1084]|uniref:Serine--tRNA ligase n=1 Tax=Berryella wangjianweii TaxID=2734634 RepID=A0A6M8J2X7_9ACTN|nr:serine--tRNA ligase [Berryella wangjianweii]NPD31077.1 serine--tRNA ligase [Berryella wangjianweii]NPD31939.1 serine--tRNA ligase [Eggerthellaceae bacterium zg-997]QKF07471.1 serine--tRNA ligase [Berryella wangjianweii]